MSKGATTSNEIIKIKFLNAANDPAWRTATHLWLALHTADPTAAGNQSSSEANYTSYARVSIVKTAAGWTVSGAQASNAALIQCPKCTGGSSTITHVSLGLLETGAGQIIDYGALDSPLAVSNLIQPQFSIGDLVSTEA